MHRNALRLRLTTWCAVLGYVVVASGLPLPLGSVMPVGGDAVAKRLATKDRSRPFPCMDKPCGCATAEQCFTNCCCHTPAETLAWARARGLEPAVLRALGSRAAATPPRGTCCRAAAEDPESCCAAEAEPSARRSTAAPGRLVTLRAMLACGGVVAQWCATAAAPPPPRVTPPQVPALVVAAIACGDDAPVMGRPAPDSPPPRAT